MSRKSYKKRITSFIMAVAVLMTSVMIMPITASAVNTPANSESSAVAIWADAENTLTMDDITSFAGGSKTTMVGATGLFKIDSSSKYYLFLPSNADCNNLKIWYNPNAFSTVKIDGTAIENGVPNNLLADANEGGIAKTHTFVSTSISGSNTTYNVTVLKSGDVGTVYIDTQSGSISSLNVDKHTTSTTGTIMVVNPDGTIEYDGEMTKMSGRGNGTWKTTNVKNPYNVKLATSTSLLGMPKAKKWVLLAANSLSGGDATLVKNQITYDFAKYIGVKYQPLCRPVDLYVNQQYYGSYQLAEKVEIKKKRVNVTNAYENLELANGTVDPVTGTIIPKDLTGSNVVSYTKITNTQTTGGTNAFGNTVGNIKFSKKDANSQTLNNPTDVTGGYLYELEISQRWMTENAGFCAYNRQGWVIKSCDYATKNMVDYSYDLLYALGSSVYNNGTVPSGQTTTRCSSNYSAMTTTNPAPATKYRGKRWSDILDADSAVKYYWTQEYFKNMDSSTTSTYFYKDCDTIDGMLYAGPVWDMDNALSYNAGTSAKRWGKSYSSTDDWYTKNARIYRFSTTDSKTNYTSDSQSPLNFYAALATNCSDFWTQAESYWYNLIKPATDILLGNAVDPKGVLHSTEYYVNTVKKSGVMEAYRIYGTTSYDANGIIQSINNWLSGRNTWIDSQITKKNISQTTVQPIEDQVCTGSPIEPELDITYNGVALQKGKDYEVSYSANTAVSNVAKATVTGLGYYTGTRDIFFKIVQGEISSVRTSTLAYAGDTLKATVVTGTDDILSNYCSYQWKANGENISGETGSSYVVGNDMQGKAISVTVTGDGYNFDNTPVTSNECIIQTGTRPEGFTKTLASWDYDHEINSAALKTADETGATFYYTATSGELAENATLRGSVDAENYAKIEWSKSDDLYKNTKTSLGEDRTPLMGTSKTDLLGWGYFPYFETTISTEGYEAIKFSARIGGSKRGPRDWNLQYSIDGTNYYDIPGTSYSIVKNKVLEDAFVDAELPSACNDVENLKIRVVANEDIAINGVNTIVNQINGDATINNIAIKGASTEVVTELSAPVIATDSLSEDANAIFSTDNVVITDTNGGADIYYTVDNGSEQLYIGGFNPFSSTDAKGKTSTVTAWARFEEIESSPVTFEVTNAGTSIGEFNFNNYSQSIVNGKVFSTGGSYGESTEMTAVTDGVSQYVPIWNDSNKAFSLSPDDGAKWSADSGFYFAVCTAGYDDICFTTKAYTTGRGPKSVKLQYSLNKTDWTDATANTQLSVSGELNQLFMTTSLPSECSNKAKVYIRLATVENLNASGDVLHNNESKGNLYINNIVISGTDNGDLKMPYSNKATNYFGDKTLKYFSADNETMHYAVQDAGSNLIMSGTYNSAVGINISAMPDFNEKTSGPYTVSVWEGDEDEHSISNVRTYYYKGSTIVKFNYGGPDSSRPMGNYFADDGYTLYATSDRDAGTLSMSPNGISLTQLSYDSKYGVKAGWASDNLFASNKTLDNPEGNGYWLIHTSTKGYTDVSLNLEQISSNYGPRDWGIAYSLDGTSYTYVENSNVRTISNKVTSGPIETYNNFPLPQACEDQESLYIKVFINGGESVNGDELETALSGNTGINGIELCGISDPEEYTITFKTVAYEDMDKTIGTTPVDAYVYINNVPTPTENGELQIVVSEGDHIRYHASVAGNSFAAVDITERATQSKEIIIPVVALDVNGDGFINAKDYAMIMRLSKFDETRDYLIGLYPGFHNVNEEKFDTYGNAREDNAE